MFTRSATRRSAAVLMMALVAMLLVAVGGSARAAQSRVSAGTGHAIATPHGARPVAALPAAPSDHTSLHLDLTSTPVTDAAAPVALVSHRAVTDDVSDVEGDVITAAGRGPPAP